ncbi:Maf family nucleotide pyrophosphatase [Actinotignum urinale]|uniref:Maf family nucleotide pyrophosphatase n=1 Tax=Actinotignum urinale TaxID=190146 RepID=UPI0015E0BF9D|nr:Maf family nucleotide pyrophosphatase [Actinotignum urinale]MDY5128622.1 Maf family nucleotide pyrophosphatase [Actinotignum urinale]WIK58526.1 Maf family nucleotide pyrophosphatase [Actinotignum urinale]
MNTRNVSHTRLPHLTLTLASKSPARLATLRNAGIHANVQVSGVDEEEVLRNIQATPTRQVMALASAKSRAVARNLHTPTDFVIGCDSMFEFDGVVYGKPHSPENARERLLAMSGKTGILHTGHCLVHVGSGKSLAGVSHARVTFAPFSAEFIDAYIATGEPIEVAGSFTADGLGGSFIDNIEGDYHGVVGISLPLLRQLMEGFGLSLTQLWEPPFEPEYGTLSDEAATLLATKSKRGHRNADGFMLCSCGHTHWGMNGAGGILAFREHFELGEDKAHDVGKQRERGSLNEQEHFASHTTLDKATTNHAEHRLNHENHHGPELQVLLQLRSLWSHSGGTWGFPGGAVNWSETPWEGASREFEEETSISPSILKPVGEYVLDHNDWQYSTFVAQCPDGVEAIKDKESSELRWVNIDDVETLPLLPSFAASWSMLKEKFIL